MNEVIERALNAFSGPANKDSACTHPDDFDRWCTFLFECVDNGANLDPQDLRQWLSEHGWNNEEVLDTLVLKYEYGMDLLNKYSRR